MAVGHHVGPEVAAIGTAKRDSAAVVVEVSRSMVLKDSPLLLRILKVLLAMRGMIA